MSLAPVSHRAARAVPVAIGAFGFYLSKKRGHDVCFGIGQERLS